MKQITIFVVLIMVAFDLQAAEWSDTWVGYRYGSQFREPANNQRIAKNIFQLQHASGYQYGTQFLNVDLLLSDRRDPARGGGGAQEVFVVYRNTVSLSRVSGRDLHAGFISDVGIKFGLDWNTKNDAFASRVVRPMIGPGISFAVPGFWNAALLWQGESNHNGIVGQPVRFANTWRLETAWETPFALGNLPAKFQGFLNYVAPKGRDGFGAQTQAETLLETSLMLDVSSAFADRKGIVYAGIGYQYWKNKFGNNSAADLSGGSTASLPQLQLEWHL